ncbi:MAG: hypothetical protein FWF15_01215 [Oscillospiraceae bacterium]|nr:hypothetical protein [Oscillospiraceae bacterium]
MVTFYSKRNKVFLRDNIVEKHFNTIESASFEAAMLEKLYAAKVRVPKFIAQENNVIKMSYIPGETIPDLLEHEFDTQKVADGIVKWFADFYRAENFRGDVNGRNFLWDGENIWGVDFEEEVFGVKEQDFGRLIAFILTYTSPHIHIKTEFADKMFRESVKTFNFDKNLINIYREQELNDMCERRKLT